MKHRIREMKEIGAQLSITGEPESKDTRQSLTADGRLAYAASKTKYICQNCGTSAWAKPHTKLICGRCYEEHDGQVTFLEPEVTVDDEQEAA